MRSEKKLHKNRVPMIVKTFEVVERLREHQEGLTYVEMIERNPEIPKISIYRILCTLESLGYLEKDPTTNRYGLGAKFFELGRIPEYRQDIIRITKPYMEELRAHYGENVNLVKLEAGEYVRLSLIEGTHPLRVMEVTSRSDDVYSSAATKIILAYCPEEMRREIVDNLKFKQLTPKTITSKRAFEAELEAVRKKGYALDDEENLLGVRCVGAAIRDHDGFPVAAISITGPSTRLTPKKIREMGRYIAEVTESISSKFFAFVDGDSRAVA
jgi:DNA-binding IclR family transcriptional regulator